MAQEQQIFEAKQPSYISAAVSDAHASYLSKNPISANAHKAAAAHLPGGNTRTVLYAEPFPLAISSASGSALTSVDGHTYVDFLGEYSAGLFGHSHPRIASAMHEALKGGWNYGAESLHEKELAARVVKRFGPAGVELVRFTNSGTEASMMAVGTAVAWTQRKKVLVFSNAYHGGTFVFPMDLCRWHAAGRKGEAPYKTVNLPHDFVYAPYNNIAETKAAVDALPADSLAAILVEPMQGAGGCRPALPEFLGFLRETADRLGALLIIDEVMTSRLGLSGYFATTGLRADILTLGKWIGGGMSFGAFGGRRDVMSMFDPAHAAKGPIHAGTFNNNVFSMRCGIVALDIYDESAVVELNTRGSRMKEGVYKILIGKGIYPAEHADFLRDIRVVDSFEGPTKLYTGEDGPEVPLPRIFISSRGSMLNVQFSGPDLGKWHNLYFHFMLEKGIYLASRCFTPLSLAITDDDVDKFLDAVSEFVTLHLDELKRQE